MDVELPSSLSLSRARALSPPALSHTHAPKTQTIRHGECQLHYEDFDEICSVSNFSYVQVVVKQICAYTVGLCLELKLEAEHRGDGYNTLENNKH